LVKRIIILTATIAGVLLIGSLLTYRLLFPRFSPDVKIGPQTPPEERRPELNTIHISEFVRIHLLDGEFSGIATVMASNRMSGNF